MHLHFLFRQINSNFTNSTAFIFIFYTYFLWGLSYPFLQYLILLPLLFLFFKNPKNYLNKKNFFAILIPIFLLLHYIVVVLYYKLNFNLSHFVKLGYFFLLSLFCVNFYLFFLNNIKKITFLFIYLSLIIYIFDILFKLNSLNFANNLIADLNQGFFCSAVIGSIFRNKFLFKEASHLGMVNVAVCLSCIYYFSIEKKLFLKSIISIYLVISLFSGVTTFILGFFISSIAIIISCRKKLNLKYILLTVLLNFIILIIFFSDRSCFIRVLDINKNYNVQNNLILAKKNSDLQNNLIFNNKNYDTQTIKKNESEYFEKIYDETQSLYFEFVELQNNKTNIDPLKLNKLRIKIIANEKILKDIDNTLFETRNNSSTLNLTNEVYIRSLFVAKNSFLDTFFGYGFENYKLAFNIYKFDIPAINPLVLSLNVYDASNNFSKLIVEFGFFSFILFIFILLSCFNNIIKPEIKIFLISIILTQLLRGVGYYNGGFFMSIIFLILSNFVRNNENFSVKVKNNIFKSRQ
jgi:hypothetical protein